MSLVGNLEDLGLGDILQIVSLSRKSGVLNLTWDERKGRIIFRDGQVVGAESNERPVKIETLLAKHEVASPEAIKQAVALKRGLGPAKTLRDILVERLEADSTKIEETLKEHVEKVIFGFFMWPEGNFSFELKEGSFERDELGEKSVELLLDTGLNPQFLAMEGMRLQDEARRDGKLVPVPMPETAEEAPPTEKAKPAEQVEAPPAAPAARPGLEAELSREQGLPQVLVIDDDPEIVNLIINQLRGMGLTGEGVNKIAEGVDLVKQHVSQGFCPVVVVDLFMPRTDGEGILGGLELVQSVKSKMPYVPVMLVSDYQNAAASKEAKSFGLDHYVDKPKRSQIWGDVPTPELTRFREEINRFIPEMVAKAVLPDKPVMPAHPIVSMPTGAPAAESLWDPGKEIRFELGEPAQNGKEETLPVSRGLHLLKSMIVELNDPEFSGQITLMVLRFAAELMNRAIIFLVMKDKVAGLGQFGVELNGVDPLRQVRRMRIPLDEPSIFRDIVSRRMIFKKPLSDTKWNNYLVQYLGGVRPVESFAAPIIAGGRVAAILYGDNIPEMQPIGDTDSLEIFLAQAGLAMERALLERKIIELSGRGERARSANTYNSQG